MVCGVLRLDSSLTRSLAHSLIFINSHTPTHPVHAARSIMQASAPKSNVWECCSSLGPLLGHSWAISGHFGPRLGLVVPVSCSSSGGASSWRDDKLAQHQHATCFPFILPALFFMTRRVSCTTKSKKRKKNSAKVDQIFHPRALVV